MSGTIDRRNFLKMMGWGGAGTALAGCDLPSTVTLEEGVEDVVAYLAPEEYVIPGVGVMYASTCLQCAAGCGTHGRVREGRVLKMEGNPDSPINDGKLCMMGQAGLQGHYNPDRITSPMMRENGQLVKTTWDKALAKINEKTSAIAANKMAWLTPTVSGHQAALIGNHLQARSSDKHYAVEVVNNAVWRAVSKDALGDATPRLRLDKAQVILSFGADFLGTWGASPVHFARQYAKFRTQKKRGLLIQIEPKMSLTGGNADLWIPSEPGAEAIIALGLANILINSHGKTAVDLPESVKALITRHNASQVAKQTGVSADKLKKIAALLAERSPSLVLAGAPVEGQKDAYQSVAAIMLLNQILGNVGQTLESSGTFPFEQLQPIQGSTAALVAFAKDASAGDIDVAFIYGSNPVYSAPDSIKIKEALAKIALKVSIAQFPDETTALADIVLPVSSYLEDWGTHVPVQQAEQVTISMQQPLMNQMYPDTKGIGDIVLSLLKLSQLDEYKQYPDYYAYLHHAYTSMPTDFKPANLTDELAWQGVLQKGILNINPQAQVLTNKVIEFTAPAMDSANAQYPLHLAPNTRLGMWDGRHANIPWLQEAPDQISKIVWNSWAEIHPDTAQKLGINMGDEINVSSANGSITLQAVIIKSIHKDVIGIPIGQGHENYGQFATGIGVNPMKLLAATTDEKTGELAMFATRVNVTNTKVNEVVVKLGASDTQMGRKFVQTISAKQLNSTEGA
ncbi:MAG: molybdopterin-dependent oxidoreductase [Thiohalomonadales bacterium]